MSKARRAAEKVIREVENRGSYLSNRMKDEIIRSHYSPNNSSLDNLYARQGVVATTPAEQCEAAKRQNNK